MDLNFVDPPMPAGASAYEPRIGEAEVPLQLDNVASWIETDEFPQSIFEDAMIVQFSEALRSDHAARLYVESLPIIARFLTIELDPTIEGENGIGRVPGEPPPRFGGRYRKQLDDERALQRASAATERLIFEGYAGMTAIATSYETPPQMLERSLEERWFPFMRSIVGLYNELSRGLDFKNRVISTSVLVLASRSIAEYSEVLKDLKLGRGLRPFSKARANSFAFFFVAVGSSLWLSATDRVQA